MQISRFDSCRHTVLAVLSLMLAFAVATSPAFAQFGGGGGGFGGGGGGGGFGGGGFGGGGAGGGAGGPNTVGGGQTAGVFVDAQGVLSLRRFEDPTGQLTTQRFRQAYAALDREIAQRSKLRKVSLTRLEKLVRQAVAEGHGPDEAMKNLAGLTRIEYVFCYPETGDIVIAGPAEPWAQDLSGRTVGIATGRPTLLLEDLIVALRAFPPQGSNTELVYCSIDPTQEGLQRMQHFLAQWGRAATPAQTETIVHNLQQSLGHQEVTIGGVPGDTHFAQVLVEADYRMKLIGIGLENPPVKMVRWIEKVNPAAVSRNALQRWFFVPNYESVRVSEDEMAMQLVGDGVKLVGENEVVGRDGSRSAAAKQGRASFMFTRSFTQNYPQLAERSPVYAQLRNCIDLLVSAAYIQDRDFYGHASWNLGVFAEEEKFSVQNVNTPEKVASAVNAMWKGHRLMTPIGGGVQIRPAHAIASENLLADEKGEVQTAKTAIDLKALAADQWWWD